MIEDKIIQNVDRKQLPVEYELARRKEVKKRQNLFEKVVTKEENKY